MSKPDAHGHIDFDNTPLGQAFIEAAEIRKEIRGILEDRRHLLEEEEPDPMVLVRQFASQRLAVMSHFARTE
jgi:hypothetical protein